VLAGAGSNNTTEAVRLTKFAKEAGADGAMLISPYYNKPTQEGLYRHFAAIAEAVDFPIMPYNVPGRTGSNLLPATLGRLAREYPNIFGVKEATGDLAQVSDVLEQCGSKFCLLSGDDFTVLPILSVGGYGVISVTANIAPAKMSKLCSSFAQGDLESARALHFELAPLNRAMFLETNPIPVKPALHLMGFMELEFRLPLCPLNEGNAARLREALGAAKLIPV
jgi:4-hydroxy-tetrahydrodipicolinate synthase